MNALRARLQALTGGVQRWYAGHSPRDQRIILGVLAFAALCSAYLFVFLPLRDYRQRVADEIVQGQEQLARASRILASENALRAERESLERRLKVARQRLLPGRGGTLGAAALQERANALAAEKGITLQSTQVMKEDAHEPYRKVAIRLTLSGELKPFAELISALEYDQQLALPIVEVNRRGAVAGAKGPRTLNATVEVTGFVLSEDAKVEEPDMPAAEGEGDGGEVAAAEEDPTAGAATTSTTTTLPQVALPPGAPPPPSPSGEADGEDDEEEP